jgi:hypothetical protein
MKRREFITLIGGANRSVAAQKRVVGREFDLVQFPDLN